jgi:preprotein translocase subunit SecE
MAKEKNATVSPFLRELLSLGIYKRSQGRIARQITFATLAIGFLVAAWRTNIYLAGSTDPLRIGLPVALALVGVWFSYRLVNLPSFADFLIAVEAEMNKVSWPTGGELVRSSMVVIFCIFFLAFILYGYDLFWRSLLHLLRIVGN